MSPMSPRWPTCLGGADLGGLARWVAGKGWPPTRLATLPMGPARRHFFLVMFGGGTGESLRLHALWVAQRAQHALAPTDTELAAVLSGIERVVRGQAPPSELGFCRDAVRGSSVPYQAALLAAHDDPYVAARRTAMAVLSAQPPQDPYRAASWHAAYQEVLQDLLGRILAQK